MFIAIDIGGTKTLVASFTKSGDLQEKIKFPTPQKYSDFLRELANNVANMSTHVWLSAGVALPGRINRTTGVGIACGNLPWKNIPIQKDIEQLLGCPTSIENDANLAGLSEAILLKNSYSKVLYVTISTGIGMGVITDQKIDPAFADSEGGEIILEHQGRLQMWEKFASGSAIVKEYGKEAGEINDPEIWVQIAQNIAVGLIDLCAITQPEVIVLGGGVSTHLEKFKSYVIQDMRLLSTPLTPVPPIEKASRPEEAVVFGCYEIAKDLHARNHPKAD